MGSGFQVNEVGRAITEYANAPNEHARSQAIDSLNTYGVINDPEAQRALTRKLEDSNLIGKLALNEFDNLNVHLDRMGRRDSLVRRDDLEQITQHTRDYAPTTVLAAQAILKDFGNINAQGGFWDGRGNITKEMIQKWSEQRANLGGVLDPNAIFSDNGHFDSDYNTGYNNYYNNDNENPSEYSRGWMHNMYSRYKAWAESAGSEARAELAKEFPVANSDADVGPGQVCMNGYSVPAKEAQGESQRDKREYTIKSGDTLTSIARNMLVEEGLEPTQANMLERMRYIAGRNNIADMNRIVSGATLQY